MYDFLIKLLQRKQQPKIQVQLVPANDMRLSAWQKSEQLVSDSIKLANHPIYKAQIEILNNENPALLVLPLGTNVVDRAVLQGRIEGYQMCLNNMEAFTKQFKPPKQLRATFAPEHEVRRI